LFNEVYKPEGWVQVAVTQDSISAGMLESALKGAGITVLIQKPAGGSAYMGIGGIHGVLVPPGQEDEAREILREIWDTDDEGG